MKAKLVRYPFNDGKRFRWDTYKMGKKFEYTWRRYMNGEYEDISPYIKAAPFDEEEYRNGDYAYVDLSRSNDAIDWAQYNEELGVGTDIDVSVDEVYVGQNEAPVSYTNPIVNHKAKMAWVPQTRSGIVDNISEPVYECQLVGYVSIPDDTYGFSAEDIELMKTHQYDTNTLVRRVMEINEPELTMGNGIYHAKVFTYNEQTELDQMPEYDYSYTNKWGNTTFPKKVIVVEQKQITNYKLKLNIYSYRYAPTYHSDGDYWDTTFIVQNRATINNVMANVNNDDTNQNYAALADTNTYNDMSQSRSCLTFREMLENYGLLPIKTQDGRKALYLIHYATVNYGTEPSYLGEQDTTHIIPINLGTSNTDAQQLLGYFTDFR
ncbi:MAG: hypothetical protein J6S67_20090 [Methanobrevibacter sp.]|nr:hypothetical protein [Methanobrevibacter sp.]